MFYKLFPLLEIKKKLQKGFETAFLLISLSNMSNDRLLRGVEESRISTTLSAFG